VLLLLDALVAGMGAPANGHADASPNRILRAPALAERPGTITR